VYILREPQLSTERLQAGPFFLERTKGVIAQIEAQHTRQQTDWIVKQFSISGAKSLPLVVSHWHMPRAYRILLKSMLDANIRVPVYPVAVNTALSLIVPEHKESVVNVSAGEVERIKKICRNWSNCFIHRAYGLSRLAWGVNAPSVEVANR
jgi:hypothetical protein